MLDAQLGTPGNPEALSGDLDAERTARLEGVSQPPQLGNELGGRSDGLDVTFSHSGSLTHGTGCGYNVSSLLSPNADIAEHARATVARMTATTRIVRHIDAPPASVYSALLDPRAVQQWMVPDGMTSEVHHFEARQGGSFRISLTYDDDSRTGKSQAHTDTFHGVFRQLVGDRQVVQLVEFESDDPSMQGEMTITYTLDPDGQGGTRLTGVHEGLPQGVNAADNELGWRISIDKLARLVSDANRS